MDRNAFEALSAIKQAVMDKLVTTKSLATLTTALVEPVEFDLDQASDLVAIAPFV